MIRKVKCDRCGKTFTAEIDSEPDREVKPQILCSRCYALALTRPHQRGGS
jgi:DNA-directed RNA polymerase subunit RPC12/RpoP